MVNLYVHMLRHREGIWRVEETFNNVDTSNYGNDKWRADGDQEVNERMDGDQPTATQHDDQPEPPASSMMSLHAQSRNKSGWG